MKRKPEPRDATDSKRPCNRHIERNDSGGFQITIQSPQNSSSVTVTSRCGAVELNQPPVIQDFVTFNCKRSGSRRFAMVCCNT